ncbi:MAG: glycosyltransferase family 2 protein [Lachnospiraceae bacterium]|nr:glycosyltransferase family 2 protein [Lachnospiraceae bacterium]
MDEQKKKAPAVSIIIPVYNVFEWLDQCMESVRSQTFSDFEILLIDDGSTDGSGLKCREWEKRDCRIRAFSKVNEGPSKARNLGLQEARGDYLVFLDADDWIDERYLELLYGRLTETGADMAECDVYRVNSETDTRTYRVCHGIMGRTYSLEEHMKYGYTAIWKCMFKKELFVRNGIVFPDCHSEARAIYPLLLAVSNQVEQIQSALYYYRIFRKGSLTASPRPSHENENTIGVKALELLLEGFERCGLYEQYKKTLEEIVKLKLSDLLSVFFYRKEEEDYRELERNYRFFVSEQFPDSPDCRYLTLGGYNLNKIVGHMNFLHDPYGRFNFSSLISLMNPVGEEISCSHKNRYREMMLKREIQNRFWTILEEFKPEYLIMNFIEERFDVITCGTGYLTKSDAFDGAEFSAACGEIISRDTKECQNLWEQSGSAFIRRVQELCPRLKIILVKDYLSETFGDIYSQKEYPNLEEIRRINRILSGYYDFFEKNCRNVKLVEASEAGPYYFTDKQYEYGVIPSHLNELVNQEIAKRIERCMKA